MGAQGWIPEENIEHRQWRKEIGEKKRSTAGTHCAVCDVSRQTEESSCGSLLPHPQRMPRSLQSRFTSSHFIKVAIIKVSRVLSLWICRLESVIPLDEVWAGDN